MFSLYVVIKLCFGYSVQIKITVCNVWTPPMVSIKHCPAWDLAKGLFFPRYVYSSRFPYPGGSNAAFIPDPHGHVSPTWTRVSFRHLPAMCENNTECSLWRVFSQRFMSLLQMWPPLPSWYIPGYHGGKVHLLFDQQVSHTITEYGCKIIYEGSDLPHSLLVAWLIHAHPMKPVT